MTALIRSYKAEDDKEVRFIMAKGAMEGLAPANMQSIFHPLSLALWGLLSSIWIQYMGWWPSLDEDVYQLALALISLMLPLGTTAVPNILFSDWINRPYFDDQTQAALHAPDMASNLETYYSRSRASGIWILELGGRTIGLIAIDASPDAEVARLEDVPKGTKRKASHTAVIRHFYVDEQYRPTGIQKDLLDHALKTTFSADSSLARVKATSSPLREYTAKALTEAGFKFEAVAATIGLLRWKVNTLVLTKGALQNSVKSRK
ncbi:hypothetical protein BDP27DRAFT_1421278 [Rhodocollybia butyracea]|uniref:N-acetyltransferase domain-containing protein n=1 Tax=Rhodocollybia butyracea TaxID=206335 RepID=A0A9P5U7S4_9AGAR|nr:hypothetical protein BDP27DRAFT_1421278 [Rhodocollybia butyracea]